MLSQCSFTQPQPFCCCYFLFFLINTCNIPPGRASVKGHGVCLMLSCFRIFLFVVLNQGLAVETEMFLLRNMEQARPCLR